MNYPKHHHSKKKRTARSGKSFNTGNRPNTKVLANPESTGTESSYLKSLIDSRSKVTVTMMDGETLQGHIRYYDSDCFSVGLLSEKRKIFLRKENVSHITEE